jgi:cell division protein FtsB
LSISANPGERALPAPAPAPAIAPWVDLWYFIPMAVSVRTRAGEDRVNRRRENPLLQSRGLALLLAFFLFILILAFVFGDHGMVEIIRTQREIRKLQTTIRELEMRKERLLREISLLQENPLALEKKARENLWLMKKNEKVVVLAPEIKETPHE